MHHKSFLRVSDANAAVGFNISKSLASKKFVDLKGRLWIRKKLK